MNLSSPGTPRRIYHKSNICVLCGFSFIQTEITSMGEKIEKKYLNKKLKLTQERVNSISKVLHCFTTDSDVSTNGVCIRCYRNIERVLKMETDVKNLQTEISTARRLVRQTYQLATPSPSKQVSEKRLLKSPSIPQTKKNIPNIFPTNFSIVNITTIPSFEDLGLVASASTCLPAAASEEPKKTARRSLGFSGSEGSILYDPTFKDEVEVSIYYPSGKKTSFVPNETHKEICRTIYQRKNVEKCIVDIIGKSQPEIITNAVSKMIIKECETVCKRGSGVTLQDRTYAGIFNFTWDNFFKEIQMKAPHTLKVITSTISNIPVQPTDRKFLTIMNTVASALHGRNQEMSSLQYQIGFILTHGACKQKDIERLAKLGVSVTPPSIQKKLSSWEEFLDSEVIRIKDEWEKGGKEKYQLIGDNWDKNILPSYRTTEKKTLSLHLFHVIAVVDRIIPNLIDSGEEETKISLSNFIPSLNEQEILKTELTFLVATSVIQQFDVLTKEFGTIYPPHLKHEYSDFAGIKTKQFPIGLFDCNETKTQDVIKLMKQLTERYVPLDQEDVIDEVFLGGDRLTDERVQAAQQAMSNADTPKQRLQGFISKIEDWHRMMNFMEAICKLTYNMQSQADRGTACYFRNFLNARNVKGEVKNSFRAYKHLYYTIFDAICYILFLREFQTIDDEIQFPEGFNDKSNDEKVEWLNGICENIVKSWFFEDDIDLFKETRDVLENPEHPENYWIANETDGRFPCHFCEKSYLNVGSLKVHEKIKHQYVIPTSKKEKKSSSKNEDQLLNYMLLMFKLTALLKNVDTAIDMADGKRSVRSCKYELSIFNKTNKLKYVIGCIHLTSLTEETLSREQRERLIANRSVNLQGGKNHNIALDEYLEMLNRDSKNIVTGHQTKESIIAHSKQYPHLINHAKHFDAVSNIRQRKGFHKLPNYKTDVMKVVKELLEIKALDFVPNRSLKCKELCNDRNPFVNSFKGLSTLIHRHKPLVPFSRLRNKQY